MKTLSGLFLSLSLFLFFRISLPERTNVRTCTYGLGVRYVKSDRNFSRTAPAVAANPFIRSPDPLSAPLSPLSGNLLSFSGSVSLAFASSLSLAIGVAMYTPGRIYRPVFQPPCGGNGFRNAADTARPVLITIHTYCPHILPIPRALPLATDYITTYGEHKLLWLPFYRHPATSNCLLRCLTTDHLFATPALLPRFFSHPSLPTFTNYRTRGRRGTVKRSRARGSTVGRATWSTSTDENGNGVRACSTEIR